jgi:hypothetical protein
VEDDVVHHTCDVIGGSSGSPLLYQFLGIWTAIGVTHGPGGPNFGDGPPPAGPACIPYDRDGGHGLSPSVDRFRLAPRFASNVAVNRRPDEPGAAALFAVDSDLDRVVYRARQGSDPTYSDEFGYWNDLGTPYAGAELSKIAACHDDDGKPQVFVVADGQHIYSKQPATGGGWSEFALPFGVTTVADIDVAYGSVENRCGLYMVADGGAAYVRMKATNSTWGGWTLIALGSYKTITALRTPATTLAAVMVGTDGELYGSQGFSVGFLGWSFWFPPVVLSRPSGVSGWRDADMTWDEQGRPFMLALPTTQNNRLHFLPMYGTEAWTQWYYFDTTLWAPNASGPQDAPDLRTLTASRWMEDPAGTTSPLVMATDDTGNIYFIEYERVSPTPGWVLEWKSFYHEYIPY